jgi:hypothetical protein
VARRTQLALQRQLKRERAHLQWLEQHLPQSMQLSLSKERIAAACTTMCQHSVSETKKALQQQRFFLNHSEQLSLLSSPLQLL